MGECMCVNRGEGQVERGATKLYFLTEKKDQETVVKPYGLEIRRQIPKLTS